MKKTNQGFTLLELLFTLMIAAILASLAGPAMSSFIQKNKMASYVNELVSAIQIARSEAIKTGTVSCVCSSSDASAATPSCNGGNNWETGWIAFTDSAGNCNFEPTGATPDVLLKAMNNSGFEKFTVRNDDLTINNNNYIRFNNRGTPRETDNSNQQGMFVFCDERAYVLDANGDTVPRGVILSASGSVRSTKDATKVTACP